VICGPAGQENEQTKLLCTIVAGLVHDVGHGPFSHTLEEILADGEIPFDHENMTLKYVLDSESEINSILRQARAHAEF
jgi:uncharacterized protein